MMATFIAVILPRAAVSRRAASRRCSTRTSIACCRRRRRPPRPAGRAPSSCGDVDVRVPRRRASRAPRHQPHRLARRDDRDHRQHRRRQDDARQPAAPAVRRHRRRGAVDGVDVRELEPEILWSRIGLVPQRPYLFTGTIAHEPALRQPRRHRRGAVGGARDRAGRRLRPGDAGGARRRRSRRAAPTCPAVSGSGSRSRGRWSSGHRCYVFDDSFSALDTGTDARLRAALDRDFAGTTRIVVAQRVSTIVDADQILVLEGGRIVGRGTHDRAARVVARLRRDRREPARCRGGLRMSAPRPVAARGARRARWAPVRGGPMGGMGMPAEKAMRFGPSAKRLLGRLAPRAAGVAVVLVLGVISVVLTVLGPRSWATRPNLVFAGVLGKRLPGGHDEGAAHRDARARRPGVAAPTCSGPCPSVPGHGIDFGALGMLLMLVLGLYVVASPALVPAGLPAQRDHAADGVPPARRRRGQGQPAAARLLRPRAARGAAEPGHERHRQHPAVAAADDEPAAQLRRSPWSA